MARKPPSQKEVTAGDGSNHSGDTPRRFCRDLMDETDTAPHRLTKIMAYNIKFYVTII